MKRSRGKPKCNEDEAFIEAATIGMAALACMEERQVRWDPVAQDVV